MKRAQMMEILDKAKELEALLAAAKEDARGHSEWGWVGTLNDYQRTVQELISCDNGEAGLEPLLETSAFGS